MNEVGFSLFLGIAIGITVAVIIYTNLFTSESGEAEVLKKENELLKEKIKVKELEKEILKKKIEEKDRQYNDLTNIIREVSEEMKDGRN